MSRVPECILGWFSGWRQVSETVICGFNFIEHGYDIWWSQCKSVYVKNIFGEDILKSFPRKSINPLSEIYDVEVTE